MFSIFNKKKKIVVDCFTCDLAAYEITPITKAAENIPDWWHSLPKYRKINSVQDANIQLSMIDGSLFPMDGIENNMRKCYGFIELYKRGVIIKNWCDTIIEVDKESYSFAYSHGFSPTFHEKRQYNYAFKDFHHIKLSSPWFFREKSGIPFLKIGAVWNNDNLNATFLHGITTFDVNSSTSLNLMLPIKENKYTIKLNMGIPLAHIIPLRDDLDISYKCHLVSDDYCNQINRMPQITFGTASRSLLKILKKNKENEKRCPF